MSMTKEERKQFDDFKENVIKLQTDKNIQRKIIHDHDVIITVMKNLLSGIQWWCRKVAWFCMGMILVIFSSDFIAGALSGSTLWSFSYSHGFGFAQLISFLIFAGLGIFLMIVGNVRVK